MVLLDFCKPQKEGNKILLKISLLSMQHFFVIWLLLVGIFYSQLHFSLIFSP